MLTTKNWLLDHVDLHATNACVNNMDVSKAYSTRAYVTKVCVMRGYATRACVTRAYVIKVCVMRGYATRAYAIRLVSLGLMPLDLCHQGLYH